jgi:hypothetical protein
MRHTFISFLAMGLAACSGSSGGSGFETSSAGSAGTDSASTTASSGGSGSASTSGTSAGSGGSASSTTGAIYDVGSMTAGSVTDGGGTMGCEKVDLLFVIDDSGSMLDNQDKLTAAFPGMAQTIDDTLVAVQGIDYRIGVMSSNITDSMMCLAGLCGPNYLGRLQHTQARVPCASVPAGRWIEGSEGAATVAEQFTCIASLNQAQDFNGLPEGGSEAPLEATRMGLSDRVTDAEAYNAGFLRPDALLVLVIVTDEDDQSVWMGANHWDLFGGPGSLAPVQQFFDFLVGLKGGHPENLVAVAISGPESGGGDTDSPRIHEFLNLAAPNSYWTDISGSDYSTALQDALSVIEGSCGGFIPPQG